MLKVAWLVRLSRERDREEVLREWNEQHAAMLRGLPGVERATHNVTLAIAEGPGAGRDEPEIDGVVCTWWADEAAFDAALRSSAWRRMLEHGRRIFDPGFEHAFDAAVVEERVMRSGAGTPWRGAEVPPEMCKHIGVLRYRADLTRDAARAWWAGPHGALALKVAEILYYVQNHAVRARALDRRDSDRSLPFDGFSEAWFSDRATFERAHASPAWRRLSDDSPNLFDVQANEAGVNCVVAERVIKG